MINQKFFLKALFIFNVNIFSMQRDVVSEIESFHQRLNLQEFLALEKNGFFKKQKIKFKNPKKYMLPMVSKPLDGQTNNRLVLNINSNLCMPFLRIGDSFVSVERLIKKADNELYLAVDYKKFIKLGLKRVYYLPEGDIPRFDEKRFVMYNLDLEEVFNTPYLSISEDFWDRPLPAFQEFKIEGSLQGFVGIDVSVLRRKKRPKNKENDLIFFDKKD